MKRTILAAIIALAVASVSVGAEKDIERQIATLKAVGKGGAGNLAARDAWRQLSSADAAALPAILAALDDAGPLGANWLRTSFDAIAERQLRDGGTLPAATLEKFAVDTRHAARARRLAYEWLCRVDPAATDRLIPGMLDDPSLEFRRDAVARLLDEAATEETAGNKSSAAATFRRALSSARDVDQVKVIVKKLEEFGERVDVPAHFGYLLAWKLIGPFDNTEEQGFDVVYPPEKEPDFAKQFAGTSGPVAWLDYTSDDPYGNVDLNKALGKANSVIGYAAAEFNSAEERPTELRLQSMNANKIWLNGELLTANKIYHAGSQIDQYIAHGQLKKGRNLILVKLCQNNQKEIWAQTWGFQLRVCDATGTAVLSQERVPKPNRQAAR